MNGKSKCKILKEIRREIARQNGIEFVTSECRFQGNCTGTCPKCEAEVRYLEQELAKRHRAGRAVAVAGIAAAMLVGATGCRPDPQAPVQDPVSQTAQDPVSQTEQVGEHHIDIIPGRIYEAEQQGLIEEPLLGEPAETEAQQTTAGVPEEPLMGDIPLEVGEVPESETYDPDR